jgi:hypothetical protein
MPIMADILSFPAQRVAAAAHQYDAPQLQTEASVAGPGIDAWLEDDTIATGSLETVASLAATRSQSLAVLVTKMEVLVGRHAPNDRTDAGLCLAEASLLRSVLRDLRAFVTDPVFAAQDADLWAPVSTGANLMQGTGAG